MLNTGFTDFFKNSFERAKRKKIDFKNISSLNELALKIEENSISKFNAFSVFKKKAIIIDSDIVNVFILFSPFLLTFYISIMQKNIFMFLFSMILFFYSFDTYRSVNSFLDYKDSGDNDEDAAIKTFGIERFQLLKLKKIDMFKETWLTIFISTIVFVLILKKNDIIMLFN